MSLNILVLGNGGREHALLWKLSQSPTVNKIYITPGNGGTQNIAKVENLADPIDPTPENFSALQKFAQEKNIDLVVPGPEQPLVDGITTVFNNIGVPVFGPSAKAAELEGSKVFAKEFMQRHNIPTADFAKFSDYNEAVKYLETHENVVIKADGVAAGKGVLIPTTHQEALEALNAIMIEKQFGSAGDSVVIEEFLEGQEISILTISDGYTYYNLPAAQDHKRIGENDTGLNTGGMGAYAPAPVATPKILREIDLQIIKPSIDGLRKDRLPFVGILFTGIILTKQGPKVLEYNVRFGDPETQTVLPLLTEETDLAQVFLAAAEHRLDSVEINVKKNFFSTTVVLAAGGYPEAYNKGDIIKINESQLPNDSYIFHAGTKFDQTKNELVTAGGRVIAATGIAPTLKDAVDRAYQATNCIEFKDQYLRKDIAHRAFENNDANKVSITYSDAGVSVDNGNLLVQKIKDMVKSTRRPGADSDIGGFGGVFDLKEAGYDTEDTLLVGATDGVGTKLIIAQETNIHNTVGIDLVAMNVNDLVVQGAEPLMFLDYFATGALDIKIASDFVSGVVKGCLDSGCALVGGETSEMPGMYPPGHYDTNGTAVGAVKRGDILPKTENMEAGNVLLGLASDGVHSNGFSLVRKVISHVGLAWDEPCPWDATKTLGEGTLVPTKLYVKQLLPSLKQKLILGLAHITGGGLIENIPRALPDHLQAQVDMSAWTVPDVFRWFGKAGNIPVDDILKTLNMGVGMVLIVKKENVTKVLELLKEANETVYEIGTLVPRPENAPGCVVSNATNLY